MIQAIVTDIEGTTSSISFVHEVLFPYARAHIASFVRAHANDPQVQAQLEAVSREAGKTLSIDEAIAVLIDWIDQDRKITPLKALQGLLWEAGYRNGDFTGHIYPDAYSRLCEWSALGLRLYVYSSGSVKAQQLLFAHTEYGDLTPMFHGYFDTTIGGKRETESYRRIAAELALPAGDILFLSDIKEELDAAKAAGLSTAWLVRGSAPQAAAEHPQYVSFADITLS
ncbi:MAG: acireductone synthase [Pseudomonadota bacterium]